MLIVTKFQVCLYVEELILIAYTPISTMVRVDVIEYQCGFVVLVMPKKTDYRGSKLSSDKEFLNSKWKKHTPSKSEKKCQFSDFLEEHGAKLN